MNEYNIPYIKIPNEKFCISILKNMLLFSNSECLFVEIHIKCDC